MILLSLGNSMGSFLFIFHSLGGAYMKNKIYIAFGVILCIIFATSCFNNNTTNSAPSTSFISENESSKNNDSSGFNEYLFKIQQFLYDGFKDIDFDTMLKENPELAADFLNDWVEFLATGETSP